MCPAHRPVDDEDTHGGPTARGAEGTQAALLAAALVRFGTEGYQSTTVRDIARDAGANVALINRYFGSKDGLFRACLARTRDELADETLVHGRSPSVRDLVERATGKSDSAFVLRLKLLITSSRDPDADHIRHEVLEHFAENLAAEAHKPEGAPGRPPSSSEMLRAEVALAALLGIVQMRSTTSLTELSVADRSRVTPLIRDTFDVLLHPSDHTDGSP
jgi:AcrR family transcriptional regulator